MSVNRSGAPDSLTVPLDAEGRECRIRGDLGSDYKVIDISVDASTGQYIEAFDAETVFPVLDDFENKYLVALTRVGAHIEYPSASSDFTILGWGIGASARSVDEPARESDDAKLFPEQHAAQNFIYEHVTTTEGPGNGRTWPDWATPQWPDWYLDVIDGDDEIEVFIQHDNADASNRTSGKLTFGYNVVEPL